jgi:hypothetical protein
MRILYYIERVFHNLLAMLVIPSSDYSRWLCPLCGKGDPFTLSNRNVSWARHGGGTFVCRKCAKTRLEEIKEHNAIYYSPVGHKKDPNCKHIWAKPHPGRYYCPKCTAEYNWVCGCGGSAYVCEEHNRHFLEKHPDLSAFLAKNSW